MPAFSANRWLMAAIMFVTGTVLFAMVPPVPTYDTPPKAWQATRIEGEIRAGEMENPKLLPNNILALRVQFADKSFRSNAAYPDFLAHDTAFFERWMFHLHDFFLDASHGAYELSYTLWPQVITLPEPMSYYGGDTSEAIDANLEYMLPHILSQMDSEIDFSAYGGVIIFHAGSGQESDVEEVRTDNIWSTFITRKNLQAVFDPHNDSYPGYPTNDGAFLKNVVVVPEDEYQDYFPAEGEENAPAYLFSIYGVLAHQFGHLLGMPTLYDNYSSNGASQGIGNWGLMGTGVWNGNGYVPAQVCAYNRYLMGWEMPVVLSHDSFYNPLDHFQNHSIEAIRLYKVPITDTEYFLIENRQQNPDASLDPYSNEPSYSFKLLPEGEQDYYDNYPLLPYFNFMENRYAGSEWDFFLPGLGGPSTGPTLQDGSGMLIWHIDENIIAENFSSNFDDNWVNWDANHKGVDLEEADGIQHLDTAMYDTYKWGSPFDSFREGNNSYFGYLYHNDLLSLPTSESYYGGVPLEIHDISASGVQMTFSVRFRWRLSSDFRGRNPINAAAIDFDGDNQDELFYPMPDGTLYMWKNEVPMDDFPMARMPLAATYTWDGEALYLPMQQEHLSRMYMLANTNRRYVFTRLLANWASHPVDLGTELVLPMNNLTNATDTHYSSSSLWFYDKASGLATEKLSFGNPITGNLVKFRDQLALVQNDPTSGYWLTQVDLTMLAPVSTALPVPADSVIVGIFMAPMIPGNSEGNLIVQCPNSIYLLNHDLQIAPGFPYIHDLVTSAEGSTIAPLSLADVDGNGSLDILIGGERGFAVVDYQGSRMNPDSSFYPKNGEGVASGLIAIDLDNDSKPELAGSFAMNQLGVYEHDFRMKSGYPEAFAERSCNLPFTTRADDGIWYLCSAADNGSIFRSPLPVAPQSAPAYAWNFEYANMARTASIDPGILPNQYQSSDPIVPGQIYLYPNPLKPMYAQRIFLNLMPTKDMEVELSIFDIEGVLVYREKETARAYLKNLEIFDIPVSELSSGVYIAVIDAPGYRKKIKFAVEK
ncbi:MAG: immune inhibitor A [Candidatus Cloacimonetes bacterium]|nr:immune inhibitor A [Candidatus Cloacimonadota bacterium]